MNTGSQTNVFPYICGAVTLIKNCECSQNFEYNGGFELIHSLVHLGVVLWVILVWVQIVIILNSNSELGGAVDLHLLARFCLDSRIASKPREISANNAQNHHFCDFSKSDS